MKKSKSKKSKIQNPASAAPTAEIDPALQASLQSLRAITELHSLVQRAFYPTGSDQAIERGLQFLFSLHSQVLAEALKNPDSDRVPELKALKDGSNKEQANG